MATQTIEFGCESGGTVPTVKLFSAGSDTVVATGSAAVEATNRLGVWVTTFTDIAAGEYRLIATISGDKVADWWVTLTLATATFQCYDQANITTLPAITANWLTAAGIASNAFTSAKFAAGTFDAVWTVSTRTLSSFGTLVADIATAVWAAVTRTLSAFAFTPTPSNAADTTAIKTKTDQFVFTVANQVDANALSGGGGGNEWDDLRAAHVIPGSFGEYVNANLIRVLGLPVDDPSDISISISPRLVDGSLSLMNRTVYSAANANLITIEHSAAEWDAGAGSAVLTIRDNYSGTYILNRLASTDYLPGQFKSTFATTIGNIKATTNCTFKLELVYGSVYKPILSGPASFKDGLQDI